MSVLRRSPRPAEGFDAGALSLRQRLSLMIGTGLAAETLVKMDDADIHHDFLLRNGVRAPLLKAGKVSVAQLQARGVASTEHLRALEYNTLDLLDGAFCAECVAAFGANEVLKTFFTTSGDAVALAGSPAVEQLGLDVGVLLGMCCGAPEAARAVLAQSTPRGAALTGVAPETLLDSGLRSATLRELGYDAAAVRAQTRASPREIETLGFVS